MPIRILHVVTYMGKGGLETMLMNYYRNIDRNKVQFDFLTHRYFEADYDKEIKALGGRIYHLPNLNPFSSKYLHALDNFFKEHSEYKIVHSHLDCMAGIPLKYAKKNGVPVRIAHAHNSNQVKDKKYLLKLFFKRNIVRHSNYRFACSKDAGDWMFSGGKYHVLYNAIDAKTYQYNVDKRLHMRDALGIPMDALVVGEVARFSEQKNHEYLIDIFKELLDKNSGAKLLLVGEGPLMGKLKSKCQMLGIAEDVIFTGLREDVADLLQAMDVFVMPSLFEGLPVVMIEAQAAGLSCVISDKVSLECEKTKGLVKQVPLSADMSVWVDTILESAKIKRRDTYNEINCADYDIIANATKLEAFYLKKYDKVSE